MSRQGGTGRVGVLAGLVLGLGVAPHVSGNLARWEPLVLAAALVATAFLARAAPAARTGALAIAAALAGLAVGAARVESIDAGAATPAAGSRVGVRGFVEAVPRRANGEVRVRVATREGRILLAASEPVPDLGIGLEVAAQGSVREPADWERAALERAGVRRIVKASAITPTGARRGGAAYFTDRLRDRAEHALSRGTPASAGALLRGFVLGQDDRIDPATVEAYQRSGLAHLLAVSGQNVVLLAVLAMPLLALAGLGLRARLVVVLGLIALYVPVAGAGPSIQRAGVMGVAGIVAVLASRPGSRWYALLLAAAATLALNPRASGDIGWQLSFAAVIGIALWAAPLRGALQGADARGSVRHAVAEGAAITLAATVATAPLMAHHFDRLSLASVLANLLALPAVAPVMWLGMLAAAVGQIPAIPVEPLTALAGVFAAYITQVAEWTAGPGWAQADVELGGAWIVACVYALLVLGAWALGRAAAVRGPLRPRPPPRRALLAGLLVVVGALGVLADGAGPRSSDGQPAGLTVRLLDVGQGDAILLQPHRGHPLLVDAGPPGGAAARRLTELGVERLAAVMITHDQSDHTGGLADLLASVDVDNLLVGARAPEPIAQARAAGIQVRRLTSGDQVTSGALGLEVLWPPGALVHAPRPGAPADPNRLSLVSVARHRDFEMLLTGDAEAEAVPLDPGPVDVLKLAHHGSADSGLDALLDRASPKIAAVSAGADNPFGHPHPSVVSALAGRGIRLFRTDAHGEVVIEVEREGFTAAADG